jgi:hypothetical protein
MAIPTGYKTPEQIAVELEKTYNRIMTAIRELNIVPTIFPEDRRRRFYSPQDVERIREWLKSH